RCSKGLQIRVLDARGTEMGLLNSDFALLLKRGFRPSAHDQVEQYTSKRTRKLRRIGERESKAAFGRRLLIGNGFRQRRNSYGLPARVRLFEPALRLKQLRVLSFMERVVLIFVAHRLDNKIEIAVCAPQNVRSFLEFLFWPI